MRVLVTGASGFIGRALLPQLVEAGHEATAAVRRECDLPKGARTVRVGDIGSDEGWGKTLDGIDAVVHLAGLAHTSGVRVEDYDRINTRGTRTLAAAAVSSGVRRLVVMSTVKVMGDLSGPRPWRESDPPAPRSPYGRSKLAAERQAEELTVGSRTILTIIRPPPVYGPGMKGNMVRMMRWIASGRPLPLPAVRNARSLLYVGNLVDAILRCLTADEKHGRGTYFVRDESDVSLLELARAMADATHRPLRRIPTPAVWLKWAAATLGKGEDASLLLGSLRVDDSSFREKLSWQPPWTLAQGLEASARWLGVERFAGRFGLLLL